MLWLIGGAAAFIGYLLFRGTPGTQATVVGGETVDVPRTLAEAQRVVRTTFLTLYKREPNPDELQSTSAWFLGAGAGTRAIDYFEGMRAAHPPTS